VGSNRHGTADKPIVSSTSCPSHKASDIFNNPHKPLNMTKKVFISHASEDKDRFVNDFATKLLKNGIDAWLDKWEMLPGDSLVDKIFEEGIKEAAAVIVVISKFSVQKPWVREELNAAFVKRINTGSKLIPVVIDDCEVPEALHSTVWQRIENLNDYQSGLDRIIASILGFNDKPPLGQLPSYAANPPERLIEGLTPMDSLVLKLSCDEAIQNGNPFVNPGKIFLKEGKAIIPESELKDSLDILNQQGYIKASRTLGSGFFPYQITEFGLESYAHSHINNYDQKIASVVSAIVNKNALDNFTIEEELKEPRLIINHILDALESNGHISQSKMMGGMCRIYKVSPTLKRLLKQ
jgi:hypothetical protein